MTRRLFLLAITIGIALLLLGAILVVQPLMLASSPAAPISAPVNAHSLVITSPRAGEVLGVGQLYSITWNALPQIDRVWLGYSECPTCLTWIATNVPNTGCYNWTVRTDNPHGTQFKLMIVGHQIGSKTVTAQSDGAFTIVASAQPRHVAQGSGCGYSIYLPVLEH
jgi:hypothetical protein